MAGLGGQASLLGSDVGWEACSQEEVGVGWSSDFGSPIVEFGVEQPEGKTSILESNEIIKHIKKI